MDAAPALCNRRINEGLPKTWILLSHLRMTIRPLLNLLLFTTSLSLAQAAHDQLVYIGTYSGDIKARVVSQGIYVYGFDSKTGQLEPMGLASEAKHPSFVAIAPDKKHLYAVSEASNTLSAFSLDQTTGKLTLLNSQSSQGSGPCHVAIDATGKVALVSNYGSGHVTSFLIKDDGSLADAASTFLQGPASKVHPGNQEGPHAHSMHFDKANKFAFACDLGCDKIFLYNVDLATAKLTPRDPAFVSTPPGSGPRHFAFHPNGKFAWTNDEIACAVTGFTYDADKGELTQTETLSTLPPGVAVNPKFSTAEVQVHPNGKFLYVSNRGHDTIACYAINEATGKLTYIENAPSIVQVPRNFGIDPTGQWLITAGQNSSNIAVFAIDQTTGKIKPTGQVLDVGSPVCVKFLKL